MADPKGQFNPDQFLKDTEERAPGGFNPDQFLTDTAHAATFTKPRDVKPNTMAQVGPHTYIERKDEPFDPQGFMEQSEPEKNVFEAGVSGVADALTFGYSDEIAAYLRSKLNDEDYDAALEEQRRHKKKGAEDQPVAYYGSAIPAALAGGGGAGFIARGAGLGSRAGRSAAVGGAHATGTSEAEPLESPEQMEQFLKETGFGAALGGLTSAGLDKLAKYFRGRPDALRQMAAERAVKATTGQGKKHIKNIGMGKSKKTSQAEFKKNLDESGRELMKVQPETGERVVTPFANVETIAERASQTEKLIGKQIGKVGEQVDELIPTGIDGDQIANKVLVEAQKIPQSRKTEPIIDEMLETAQEFQGRRISFREAQELKSKVYKFDPSDPTQVLPKDATNAINRAISEEMEVATQTALKSPELGPEAKELLGQYIDLKRRYGIFTDASEAAQERAIGNLSNRVVSPSDYGMGATGALMSTVKGIDPVSSMVIGAATSGAHKMLRTRGSSASAAILQKMAEVMQRGGEIAQKVAGPLAKAAEEGPRSMLATHYILTQMHPEYAAAFEEKPR